MKVKQYKGKVFGVDLERAFNCKNSEEGGQVI